MRLAQRRDLTDRRGDYINATISFEELAEATNKAPNWLRASLRNGRIAALGDDLGTADEVTDARGKLVLPGGIDSHVHFAQPSSSWRMPRTTTRSASLRRSWRVPERQPQVPWPLAADPGGARGDAPRHQLGGARRCADHDCSRLERGGDGADPMGADPGLEGVWRDLSAVSGADREGSRRPQYGGAKYVCSPPPRDEASQKACWLGIETGVFQVFSSDHCPFRYDDPQGKLIPKGRTSFRWVPNGIPGVETRLPILFSEGVVKGRITINQFVALTATNHAKMYGLHPRKGTIAVGADADIAMWDPERRVTISQALLHHGSDYTPYEGIEITGWPVTTIVRGKVVVKDGALAGDGLLGQHVSRNRSPYAVPNAHG